MVDPRADARRKRALAVAGRAVILRENRRGILDSGIAARVMLIWLVVSALQLATNFGAIAALRFPDPDDVMRLIEVRDWLAGQGWFDMRQHRIGGPDGVAMHWSRLVDLPIAAIVVVLTPLFGTAGAELAALVTIPLLALALALLLAGRIAWRLVDEEAAGLACLALALAVPVVAQLRPLRIDHHGWQIVLALLALNGLMARDARRGGWLIGGALATSLAISLEALPLTLAFLGIAATRWIRCRQDAGWTVHTAQALCAVSALLFVATRGFGDLANHCDAIAPIHLAMFGWAALGLTALAALPPHPRPFLIGGLAIVAGGAAALYLLAAPQCAGGAFSALDPLVRTVWYDSVAEAQPLWRQDAAMILQIAAPPLVGILAALRLAAQSREWLRRWWFEHALLLVAAFVVAVFLSRAAAVACALAAPPIGWQIKQWLRNARTMRDTRRKCAAAAAAALALAPSLPLTLLSAAAPSRATAAPAPTPRVSSCNVDAAVSVLNGLPKGTIFAPLDIGPRLLLSTEHRVVATGHHRAAPAMHDVIAGFRAEPASAQTIVRKWQAGYIALCPGLAEAELYAAAAPEGLMAKLQAGQAIAWLEPIAVPSDSGLRLWRVLRPGETPAHRR